ncbi:MAG: hypothetical protein IJ086_03475 [Clostridium sp.]|nr:hypothetical protein [Clostridium sp.]
MELTNKELQVLIKLIEGELDKSNTAYDDEFYVNLLTKLIIEYCEHEK